MTEELNGVLTSYMLIIHQRLNNGSLKHVASQTVSSKEKFKVFGNLKEDTEYAIEIHAGTKAGFGPPGTIHQNTLGPGIGAKTEQL